jgi:DNA-directed RNA polymerase subunit beta'
MINKMKIVDPGDTDFVEGLTVSLRTFIEGNKPVLLSGGVPAKGNPIMLGITKSSLETDSFLSAASFQETTRVLTDAAIKNKIDHLVGLKENIIIGKLIPAGTGSKEYKNLSPQTVATNTQNI